MRDFIQIDINMDERVEYLAGDGYLHADLYEILY